jgi:SAM-dependent methyltransferase
VTDSPIRCRWCGETVEHGKKNHGLCLPKKLQPALKALEKDLLARAKTERVEAGLKKAWEDEQKVGQTGLGFEPWRRERVTQLAVAWILSVVFVRTLEDRGYVDPRVAGATADALRAAEDREALFLQEVAPYLGPREYLLAVFRELAKLPGTRDVFDTKHNPVWVLSPSSEGARALLDFFRKRDASGAPALVFAGEDTRFLGDLYQDLSEAVRKRYALLQTPEFVEEFILDQTLDPAIAEFGLKDVTLIDPTCGSGHFLLGAFCRLLGRWQKEAPTENIADLARRVLDQVYGIDINPYAVAIARFRLVLALLDAVGIKRLERAPDIRPNVVVADSLLHRFDQRVLSVGQISMDDDLRWGDRLFRLENRGDVERVLTRRFHAVLGNPPYITEKDASKRKKYRDMYESAAGKYALAAPFTERFFDLAIEGGFVGLINSNAWTKREFGKTLIEKVLPRFDVQKVIDTSGCYLPGHGTPTLLLFGRNRKPSGADVVAVLGKRGERDVPAVPANAPVWSEIVHDHDHVGYDGHYISVESIPSSEVRAHPWVLAGGGARPLLGDMSRRVGMLARIVDSIGVVAFTLEDAAFVQPRHVHDRAVAPEHSREFVIGENIKEWAMGEPDCVVFPYTSEYEPITDDENGSLRILWPSKTVISNNKMFGGKTKVQCGYRWFEFGRLTTSKLKTPYALSFALVATHFRTLVDRSGRLFERSAPVIKLPASAQEADHQALAGFLNSSVTAFWCRLVMFPKGGDQAGEGARLSAAQWSRHLEYGGNQLQQLPVPGLNELRRVLLDLVVAAEEVMHQMTEQAPTRIVKATLAATPKLAWLRDARSKSLAERARLRGILVSLQEEMDWRVYGLFGLPTVEAPSVDAVRAPVEPNHRPLEVRLAREVATDISASEWFRVHKREAPKDVGGPLADLYRQRLRLLDDPDHGKHLRLLETPETKRRWSPPDEAKSFSDAVRTWLLERIEASFREQSIPELRTARQLALELGRDPAVAAAHELLTEDSGLDFVKLISDLFDSEGVPFLAGYRYAETGMEKRASWEETWRLQRLEDEGKLAPELKRLNLKAIPVPDKYGPKDFLRHYWSLRGKLDVPKERFVTVPGGNTDEDSTPLVGWAGWNHLQVAEALAALYLRRRDEDWNEQDVRLLPLLAGIAERVPWLLQWHNEPSAAYGGSSPAIFIRDLVADGALRLGVAIGDLSKWTPPAATKRATVDPNEVLAALKSWKPEVDEDEDGDEEVEQPEGPTEADLASEVGVTKALIKKALKKLEADGLVEKLSGRPARYVATGDGA